ncbi:MAG: periplasmic heavy metal sensor [Acidobacteria bacterium]|nr:periplasmic heavy metal sensor [Acidobacteriota bacterium]
MRLVSKLLIASVALATPIFVAAQAPPPGSGGPDPRPSAPGWGQQYRRGPGMGQQMGMRGQRGHMMRQALRRRFMRRHPGMVMNRMLQNPAVRERLKITPDQVAKFQAQQSAFAKAGIRNHAEIQVKRMELGELMRAEKPDRVLIDKKLRELQDASFAAQRASVENRLAMRELFTAEQRQEMGKMREEFRSRWMQRGPGGPGPGGPPQQPQPPPPADNGE